MSKCIPFILKYEDSENQPVTKLFYNTGKALLEEAAFTQYLQDIKNELISKKDNDFKTYLKDNGYILTEELIISLGCDFIIFFSERSNFFEVKEIKVGKELSRRIITPKSDLNYMLENITYMDTEQLPMIVKPMA